ncbi:MAG TPA: hypothetical protein VEV84_14900 [Pyrinomonadaceae bacterium]|nr:hypothetical protein [Pyrinomonadaceae bacterium]
MKSLLGLFAVLLIMSVGYICAQSPVDEYGNIIPDDEFGHLGYFSDKLKADSVSVGTIVIYKDTRETTGHFLRHYYGVSSFLTKVFKLSPEKFKMIFGGEGERRTKLYIGPAGTSNLHGIELDETLRGKISKDTLFDWECIDCDPVVFINGFIFREGMVYLARALLANPGTISVIKIGRVEYLSKTAKERRELKKEIRDMLIQSGLRNLKRVRLRFAKGSFAFVYIIPTRRSSGLKG